VSQPKRVLFVCIGNACRSQMAEAFARHYGRDVMVPASAGLSPAMRVASDTIKAMDAKGIDLRDQFPKTIRHLGRAQFDLVINMSGMELPPIPGAQSREWDIPDPIFFRYDDHCHVRDEIERMVMTLILELRNQQRGLPRERSGQSEAR
jgi:arsenate reductase (thioredoxin)